MQTHTWEYCSTGKYEKRGAQSAVHVIPSLGQQTKKYNTGTKKF